MSPRDFVVDHQTNAPRVPDAWDGLPCCTCGRDLVNGADDYDTCESCRAKTNRAFAELAQEAAAMLAKRRAPQVVP